MNRLPVVRAHMLADQPPEKRWLIEGLWSHEAVGIIGGEPKCGKSILALSIAVAVAAGVPCLGQFLVNARGRVLLFAAEDALHVVKSRIAAIALSYGVTLAQLDLFVITRATLRLDIDTDYDLLKNTVAALAPTLLILDPFVRLHRVDENAAGDVAPLLSRLRTIQRTSRTSVILVHHARKDSKHGRQGQALRGSSEFHAWGDSNLYLRRTDDSITLSVEHRAERALPPLTLALETNEFGPYHQIVSRPEPIPTTTPVQKILALLTNAPSPLRFSDIRSATKLRSQVVSHTLNALLSAGSIAHSPHGYSIPA